MLLRIRDGMQRHKWLAWVMLGAVAATFIFWGGANSLDPSGASKQDAVSVDGEVISAEEAGKAWADTQARWSQERGTEIPPELKVRMQERILEVLALRKLLDMRLTAAHYRVSDATVLSEAHNNPNFKGVDGKYDPLRARAELNRNGKTERQFIDETRFDLVYDQFERALRESNFLTRSEQQRLFNLENEEREVQFVHLAADKFAGTEPVDDAAIKAYYDKNGDRFMTTESVALEYADLRLETLAAQVVPTEADLQKLYDDNRPTYVQEERRRARHIVIEVSGDDDAAALKRAESVLAEARAGKDFAELAKKYSKDSGTASDGGELGFVKKADFPGAIGDTLFSMSVGDIAGPVKSQFGYHLIKLEEIQAGEAKPFADVRAELDSQYRQDRAADLFDERQEQISDRLQKGEADIDRIAQNLGLTRGSIPEFLRGGGAEPLGSSIDLQQLVFSDETLNQGKIGGPLALGEDRVVLVKVTAHHKAEVKPLAVVHDEIVALLKQERGVAAAKAAADAAIAKLNGGEKLDVLARTWNTTAEPARFVSRGDPSIPAALRTAIFEAPRPTSTLVAKTAALDDGSTAVFIVTRTRVADSGANPTLVQQQNMMLQRRVAQGDVAAYINEAKRKAKIVKNPAVFE